ncbi:MAG: hypothetical protein M3O70_18565, partial [Actinomycetota bacterium]|nr:hypothetical protein [Actinomycetota bacterium]
MDFEAIVSASIAETSTACDRAQALFDYAQRQVERWTNAVWAVGLVATVAIIAAIILVLIGQTGEA